MDKFLMTLGDEKIVLLFTCFIATYMSLLAMLLIKRKSRLYRDKNDKEKAYGLLLKANEHNTLDDNAIYLIYNRIIKRKFDYITYIDFLESFVIFVRQEDDNGALTKQIESIIKPILERERTEKPYTSVNERERRILLAIEDSAKKGETASLKNNLEDLSNVIENNQKSLDRARATNKWTIPISIIGIIITIFIWLYGSSISEKDVQRISNQIYITVMDSLNTAK
ncbi:MAG: hypothetical protein K6A73_02240 [Bacteroidales bacterium]|nr:hypothetical protein [Bacteroidales bacterium]